MSTKVSLSRNPYKLIGLKNNSGLEVVLSPYGARIVSIRTPDRNGKTEDVVLGYSSIKKYLEPDADPYFGATVGRFAGRIGGACFKVDDKEFQLTQNDGTNSLHGGDKAFDKVDWYSEPMGDGVRFSLVSVDGDNGFPGTLDVEVTYTLNAENELCITYQAATDKATPINLTNHVYLNLAGEGTESVLNHELQVAAEGVLVVDTSLIPTGEIRSVEDTAFDFRSAKNLGRDINAKDEQLNLGGGYDHTWVLNKETQGALELAAILTDPQSGRTVEVLTTEPGIQVYTANFLNTNFKGKSGRAYGPRSAVCLETQHFPDSPNKPQFPNTILRPGDTFESKTIYRFGVNP